MKHSLLLRTPQRRLPLLFSGLDSTINCPFPWGSRPRLIYGCLGPPESVTQAASRSVQSFLQGSPLSFTPSLITVILSTINCLSLNYLVSSRSRTLLLVLSWKLPSPVVSLPSYAVSTERIEYKLLSLNYKVLSIRAHSIRTHTHRQTDRPRYCICSNRLHLAIAAMRPNNRDQHCEVYGWWLMVAGSVYRQHY